MVTTKIKIDSNKNGFLEQAKLSVVGSLLPPPTVDGSPLLLEVASGTVTVLILGVVDLISFDEVDPVPVEGVVSPVTGGFIVELGEGVGHVGFGQPGLEWSLISKELSTQLSLQL